MTRDDYAKAIRIQRRSVEWLWRHVRNDLKFDSVEEWIALNHIRNHNIEINRLRFLGRSVPRRPPEESA